MEVASWYINPELEQTEIDKRLLAANHCLQGLEVISSKTNSPEVQNLMKGVLADVAVAKPDPEKHIVPIQGPEQPTILLIPLFTEDADTNDTTRMLMGENSPQAARYTENKPGRIYFNAETAISTLLMGVLVLHEAKHAEFYESNQFRTGSELDHWLEEAATFEFEFELLDILGGQPYTNLMKTTEAKFADEYKDEDGRGGQLPKPKDVDVHVLDDALGAPKSDQERSLRQSIVWMNATFRLLDKVYPGTAERDIANFLRQLYTQQ